MAVLARFIPGVILAALLGLSGFIVGQSADSAAVTTWRQAIEQRLDRIEDKLDRLVERR